MSQPLILIIEDEASLRRFLVPALANNDYQVLTAATGADGLAMARSHNPDIILLDLGLPDLEGGKVLQSLRQWSRKPILIISARNQEQDKVQALDLGADDYLTKPFGLSELHARMRAVLRRAAGPQADTEGRLVLGPVVLDVPHHEVTVAGTPVELTPREFELLKVLLSQPGRVVTAGRILRAVWGTAYSDEAHYLHVYVSRLRRKLAAADPSGVAARLIVAEPGVGYRIVGE